MVGLGKGGSSIPVMKRKAQEGKEGAGQAKRAAFGDLTNARLDRAELYPGKIMFLFLVIWFFDPGPLLVPNIQFLISVT